jgi:predicted nucleic acid-binding protein
MIFAIMDASALVKRYVVETGTDSVNHVFHRIPLDRMHFVSVGLTEVVSVLVRKRNAGRMPAGSFCNGYLAFQDEICPPNVGRKIAVGDGLAIRAFPLVDRHSINATDAIILLSAIDIAAALRANGDDLVLVASDQRLLRAAQAEGLATFDPETQSAADLDAILGP